jgi:hypothetical protein
MIRRRKLMANLLTALQSNVSLTEVEFRFSEAPFSFLGFLAPGKAWFVRRDDVWPDIWECRLQVFSGIHFLDFPQDLPKTLDGVALSPYLVEIISYIGRGVTPQEALRSLIEKEDALPDLRQKWEPGDVSEWKGVRMAAMSLLRQEKVEVVLLK